MAKAQEKIDLFKEHKAEYKATAKPEFVEVGPAQYLMIDGQDVPGDPEKLKTIVRRPVKRKFP